MMKSVTLDASGNSCLPAFSEGELAEVVCIRMMILVVRWVIFISCIFISSIHAATDPDDASALKVMYTSLNSPSQLTKWTSNGGDPCGESWMGVICLGSKVTEIKISGLGLTGSMGYQLANLKSVINLDMSNNNLGNQLPYQLPPNMQRLHLGGNSFNGALPYSISMMKALKYLNVSHNQFNLQLNDMFQSLSALTTLDLSFNSIPGILPQSFSLLSSVTTLYLQNNQFTGTINVLANLPLQNLNVANNRFIGWVPEQLKTIIQDNGNPWSSGQAPPPPPGSPPVVSSNKNNKPSSNKSPPEDGGAKKSGVGGGAIAGIVISVLVVGAFIAFFLVKKKSRRSIPDEESLDNQSFAPLVLNEAQKMKTVQTLSVVGTKTFDAHASINLKPPPFDRHKSFDDEEFINKPVVTKKVNTVPIDALSYSIADLQMATGSFSVDNLIGEGSFGRVYRAQFDDGMVFAVKKINPSILPHSADFTEIVSNMSQFHHPNVTELVGYCSEHGQHLLVHEFHNNGSLHEYLHLPDEHSNTLIWNTRVKIALGTARALEYLHEICSPPVVHKNFKSANILLGVELNPHLTDCGLASFLPNADQVLIQDAGSGTSAPEVAMSGQYSIKSDVYSFGVVMLELMTGRKPFDSLKPRAEQSLVRWASPQLHDIDALTEMVDPALKGLYSVKSLSRFADVIARCVQIEPEFRPPMSEVVESLVLLVQRANMSRRTNGSELGSAQQMGSPDYDYM